MLRRFWELLPDDPQTRAGAARVRLEQGDIAGAKQQLLGVRLAPDVQYAFEMQVRLPLIEHDYDEAKKGLVEALSTSPAKLDYRRGEYRFLLAWTQRLSGNESAARKTYRQAQKELEDVLQASSDQPEALMYLAFVHAALGEKEPAIRRAKEAMGLRPSIIDHWSGPGYEEALARVKAQTGDTAGAIADLNRLLKTNYIGPESMVLTRAVLKVDPVWDSLRGEPAFQALLR